MLVNPKFSFADATLRKPEDRGLCPAERPPQPALKKGCYEDPHI